MDKFKFIKTTEKHNYYEGKSQIGAKIPEDILISLKEGRAFAKKLGWKVPSLTSIIEKAIRETIKEIEDLRNMQSIKEK